MEKELIEILSQSDLFKGIALSEIELLLQNKTFTIKSYGKNDVFALAGDKVGSLMIVVDGALIARMVSDSGRYVQIDKIDLGRIIAPAMLFASDDRFPVNVVPEADAKVFFMHKETFLKAMHENEKLLFNFIQIVSNLSRFLSKKIHSLSLKSIRGKLAEYILQMSEQQGGSEEITFNLTRQELADKFAVSRQALSRSLSELEDEGLIEINSKKVSIINRTRLMNEE